MKSPFDILVWALAIGVAWITLISMTGLDVWLKKLVGNKGSADRLEERVTALEGRVAELEKK
ncbi:MAG TPA: hypothetical protein VKG78_10095 [Opitutaceae bacterium]|nr:hypothetical protein [Opitutaceae bacterium]